jgi:hypothetical protein
LQSSSVVFQPGGSDVHNSEGKILHNKSIERKALDQTELARSRHKWLNVDRSLVMYAIRRVDDALKAAGLADKFEPGAILGIEGMRAMRSEHPVRVSVL